MTIADHLIEDDGAQPHAIGLICLLRREFGEDAACRAFQ